MCPARKCSSLRTASGAGVRWRGARRRAAPPPTLRRPATPLHVGFPLAGAAERSWHVTSRKDAGRGTALWSAWARRSRRFGSARLDLPRERPGTGMVHRELIEASGPAAGRPGDEKTPLLTAASYGDAWAAGRCP